ncbi:MAG: hypothetical protein ACTHWW_07555 [Arthrobacter sp.]|uniref:hypothetical protein n=1 Tax=unclassified Arthrobacter TaxID=235627 RepID=UPI00264E1A5B|nr:DUF3824 domain-containing protein [Micrococcaceae bacterium]MDN5879366.1 DUF3824 domain-containing protein [Micrococcaceae bacterium]MDN5887675.1 DUF3824 domain-containing protein [Micrococcaceae bacterium]MDN5905795.1 DUF3824 domain-containing protein [Micrococcaceae bacterium]MDN6299597.1 DUF3824 domain-containing protein [Micrococcaceae bacterium]
MTEQNPYDPAPYPGPQGQGGYPHPYPGQNPWYQQPPAASGLTKAAMIIGIVAIALAFIPVVGFISFILGPLALVLGIIGLVKRVPRKGFALTGVITGAAALIVCIIYVIIAVALANVVQNGMGETAPYTYSVTGDGAYTVDYTAENITSEKTEEIPGGEFTKDVTANSMLGTLTAHNAAGSSGDLSCTISKPDGSVVAKDSASGAGARVACLTGEGFNK